MNKKQLNKGIDYVQTALKQDEKTNPKRPINEFAELVQLVRDQFDDNYVCNTKRDNKSKDVLDQKDTVSIEEFRDE